MYLCMCVYVCSVLQIISLQNQIWDLEQAESRGGETSLQPSRRILGNLLPTCMLGYG